MDMRCLFVWGDRRGGGRADQKAGGPRARGARRGPARQRVARAARRAAARAPAGGRRRRARGVELRHLALAAAQQHVGRASFGAVELGRSQPCYHAAAGSELPSTPRGATEPLGLPAGALSQPRG